MGILSKNIETDKSVYGKNIVEFYKSNTNYMYQKYLKSDEDCKAIPLNKIQPGGFYFFNYLDDSNWLQYSPVFCSDVRKFKSLLIILAVNFNFIPLELRGRIFDKFITEDDIEENSLLKVDYQGMYSELIKCGFEYSIIEYNLSQIKIAYRINLRILPRFLYSSYPTNTYDPKKLMHIWKQKLDNKDERNKEMILSTLEEFYDINNEISEKYDALKDHIQRLQKSIEKYGN